MTREGGKPFCENRDEIEWTAACFDYYAEIGRNSRGSPLPPVFQHQVNFTIKEPYGVVAAIIPWYTNNMEWAMKAMERITAGTFWINDPLTDNDAGPFGGMRQTGHSRELGEEGLDEFRETKHVHLDYKQEIKPYWYPYSEYNKK